MSQSATKLLVVQGDTTRYCVAHINQSTMAERNARGKRAGLAPRPHASAGQKGIGPWLQKASGPAFFTAALLCAGYGLAAAIGDQSATPPAAIVLIVVFVALMSWATNRGAPPPPTLDERVVSVLRGVSLLAICVELLYFGVPLLGSVPYNEFGWPVVHHVAVMHWLLVLLGRKHKILDLVIALSIAILLFNRQMALFTLLAYLMTTAMSYRKALTAAIAAVCFVSLVGIIRNEVFRIETNVTSVDLPFFDSLFFVYLYLTGPLVSGLALNSDLFDAQLSAYWNTVPEWAILSAKCGIPPALSFAIFFGIVGAISYWLRRTRTWETRCLGLLIHVYSYFCFFSGVLLSTPIIAGFLIVYVSALCRPRRRHLEKA